MSHDDRCPHCRAQAGVSQDRRGAQRCKLCGGPRVTIADHRIVLSGDEVAHLVEARSQARAAWLWTGITVLFGSLGAFFLLLVSGALLLFGGSLVVQIILLILASAPLLAALGAWRRVRRARSAGKDAVQQAQLSAARDVLGGSDRELTALQMARYLELPAEATERLLATLNVDDSVMSHVTDTGEITYRLAPLRVRIDEAFAQLGNDDDLSSDTDELSSEETSWRARHPSRPGGAS